MRLEKVSRVAEKGLTQHEDHAPDSANAEVKTAHWTIIPELPTQTIDRPAIGDPHIGQVKPEAKANIIAAQVEIGLTLDGSLLRPQSGGAKDGEHEREGKCKAAKGHIY